MAKTIGRWDLQPLAAIRAQGSRPNFVLKGGTSDMNVVGAQWTCPIIAYGPGDSALDHTPDERIRLDEYAAAVATLRRLIETLAEGAEHSRSVSGERVSRAGAD